MVSRIRFGVMQSAAWMALWLPLAGAAQEKPAAPSAAAEVTIEAQRADLEHRLRGFVGSITAATPRDDALLRWRTPICPYVVGLPREQGEYVLERLSQIAREAGAQLDDEHCRLPNLVVVVTSEADALVKEWGRHRSAFGGPGPRDTPAAFARFREKPRPIRVWYDRGFGSPDGSPILNGSMQAGISGVPTGSRLSDSRLNVRDVLVFAVVAVIVDGKQVLGLQIGQLADYIAMVALTEIDLDAPLGSAPTILRLFAARASGEHLPTGLSAWDQEFLKTLYRTSLMARTQRSAIADNMVKDLAR